MLQLDKLAQADVVMKPFRHVLGAEILADADAQALGADFPDPGQSGFFPVETLKGGASFNALIDELRSEPFQKIVGEKLDHDLTQHPQMIVVRRWSAKQDGRVHTDGQDKVATALLYLNPSWMSTDGALRYLDGPDLNGPGTDPVSPLYGAFTAFKRADNSWHGHPPFEGERRVVQVFWLQDEAALARKNKRHKRTGFLKRLFGGGKPQM